MQLTAYLINNLFLLIYTIVGGIDFGFGAIILIFLFRKRNADFIFKIFSPVWEVNNVFLIFFIVTFYFFFPKAVDFYSGLYFFPAFLALLFLLIRTGSYLFLIFDSKKIIYYLGFGISSVLACIFLSSYYLQFISPVGNSLDLINLSPINLCFFALAILFSINLAAAFNWIFIKYKNNELYPVFHNILRVSSVMIFILYGILTFYEMLNNLDSDYVIVYIINSLVILGSTIYFVGSKSFHRVQTFLFAAAPIVTTVSTIVLTQYPYFSKYTNISISKSLASHDVLVSLMIVIVLGLAITVPSMFVFYKMFFKGELDNE